MRSPPPVIALVAALGALAASPQRARAQECVSYERAVARGQVSTAALDEVSGLVASRAMPGVFWTHNDSGDAARVFALDETGLQLGRFDVPGARAVDWEDIALGPCGQEDCLYIADFGNNAMRRDDQTIYRVVAPRFDIEAAREQPIFQATQSAQAMRIAYPYESGERSDNPNAETLLLGPDGVTLHVITKEDEHARVLRAMWRASVQPVVLEHIGQMPLRLATGGDWRADGERLAVRNYAIIHEFDLHADVPLAQSLVQPSRSIYVRDELQGEAVAYAHDGLSLWSVSEGDHQPVHQYTCVLAEPDGGATDMRGEVATADMALAQPDMRHVPPPQDEPGAPERRPERRESGCHMTVSPSGAAPAGGVIALGALAWGMRRRRRL